MGVNPGVRIGPALVARGLAVMIIDANTDLNSAVQYMTAIRRPVTVVATSRGALRAAAGIRNGARPDALVLAGGPLTPESGGPRYVTRALGAPEALPRTLVIHHRRDACQNTAAAGVEPFVRWAAGRATAVWVDGGTNAGDPCGPYSHHAMAGLDDQVVGLIAGFR
jgi:hypothetical protein